MTSSVPDPAARRTFLVHALDGPAAAQRRAELRPAHSARLAALRERPDGVELLVYGPLVAEDGRTPVGSAFLVAADSRAAVADRFAADPFATGGVWATVQIHELVVSANAPVRLAVPEGSTP